MSSIFRILTNLEHLERKYSLNRSLSLNYKSQRSNNECCCNANKADKARLSLTKDEKTDKNKRRQLHDTSNIQASSNGNGSAKYRRHSNGSRSMIRRRHTVGGIHDYPVARTDIKPDRTNCHSFINHP